LLVAKDFEYPDRDQAFLLPPDMREWLPEGHLVWLVIDTVAALDLTGFRKRAKLGGAGRAPLDPGMLLTLLIYAYALGQRSSRQIERLCETDVAFKVICGNNPPDHTVIARFRAAHDEAFAGVFTQVLRLCASQGLGRFGVVAIDGTKITADASKYMNRSEDSLRAEAARILAEAAAVDAAEDAEFGADRRGDELPPELADPATRKARIAEALAQIEAEKAAETQANMAAANLEGFDARITKSRQRLERVTAQAADRWERRTAREAQTGRRSPGRRPVPPQSDSRVRSAAADLQGLVDRRDRAVTRAGRPTRKRSTTANTTDPDSRLLSVTGGFIQGFNAQLAVTADQLITAVAVSNQANDTEQFIPMMRATERAVADLAETTSRNDLGLGVLLADAGYFTEANLTAEGPDRLIAAGDRRDQHTAPVTSGDPPSDASPADTMRHRVATAEGRALYRQRSSTVEPVNGHLKDRIGLRRFSRRGMPAALGELNLAAATLNLLKLHRAAPA
jgi:transposase